MNIFSAKFYPVQNNPVSRIMYKKLLPLPCDSVSFGSGEEKKSQKSVYTSPKECYFHLYNLCLKKNRSFFENAGVYEAKVYLNYYFNRYKEETHLLSELCDKELNSILLDKGINNFSQYLNIIRELKNNKTFDLLKRALVCSNPDGSKLRQNQKVQLIDMLNGYKILHLAPTELIGMVKSGKIDISGLQNSVLKSVLMYSANYSKKEIAKIPKEKLQGWNMEYAYLLPSSVKNNPTGFEDVVRLANSENDFKSEIHSDDNCFAAVNLKTKTDFENYGLNYDKWLSPSEKNNVRLIMNENDIGGLEEIAEGVADAIDLLIAIPPIRKIIDKKYKAFINDDKFEFPENMVNNKAELLKFLIKFDNDMISVWKRAEKNLKNTNEDVRDYARVTMKMKEYISEYLKILHSYNPSQNIDLTIKMWDRVPQKDLFQGNYSTCCLAIGKSTSQYVPSYLLNTVFNMVELVDNKSGNTIGNSLCYYLLNEENKPVLIFDNVEINNSFNNNLSSNMLKQIRAGLVDYAQNLNKEISNDEIPVYIGTVNNDVPIEDLEAVKLKNVSLLGNMEDYEETYADVFGGNVTKSNMNGDILLKLLKK